MYFYSNTSVLSCIGGLLRGGREILSSCYIITDTESLTVVAPDREECVKVIGEIVIVKRCTTTAA